MLAKRGPVPPIRSNGEIVRMVSSALALAIPEDQRVIPRAFHGARDRAHAAGVEGGPRAVGVRRRGLQLGARNVETLGGKAIALDRRKRVDVRLVARTRTAGQRVPDNLRIRGPIDGVVGGVMPDPGAFVRGDLPVMRVARMPSLKVEAVLHPSACDRIAAAIGATIAPEGGAQGARRARACALHAEV